MQQIEIKSRWTGSVIKTVEVEDDANLSGANLSDASRRGTPHDHERPVQELWPRRYRLSVRPRIRAPQGHGAGGRMKILTGFAIAGFLLETAALLVSPAFAALLGVGFCGSVLVYGATHD